jgi:hypothetical protein
MLSKITVIIFLLCPFFVYASDCKPTDLDCIKKEEEQKNIQNPYPQKTIILEQQNKDSTHQNRDRFLQLQQERNNSLRQRY